MAGEIACDNVSARTLYANVRNRTSGYIWNGSTFELYSALSGAQNTYVVAMTEQSSSAHYIGTFPSAITPGTYDVNVRNRINAWYAETDTVVANGQLEWNGSVALPLSNMATSGQLSLIAPLRLTRGVMVRNFHFSLVSAADHITNFVSGVVSGQIARDGGSFGALQSGNVTETGLGWFRCDLTSGDLDCTTAALHISAVGISGGAADPRQFSFVLQRNSGNVL